MVLCRLSVGPSWCLITHSRKPELKLRLHCDWSRTRPAAVRTNIYEILYPCIKVMTCFYRSTLQWKQYAPVLFNTVITSLSHIFISFFILLCWSFRVQQYFQYFVLPIISFMESLTGIKVSYGYIRGLWDFLSFVSACSRRSNTLTGWDCRENNSIRYIIKGPGHWTRGKLQRTCEAISNPQGRTRFDQLHLLKERKTLLVFVDSLH